MKASEIFKRGIIEENPTLVQVIGMCPTLAVTSTAVNGLGMGLSTTAVLLCSNFAISLVRNFIPSEVRIPCYIVIIASFVTVLQLLLEAYMPGLNNALGIYIPLIVVNCLILARAEAFASKNKPLPSLLDGIAMGLGFTIALTIIGGIREILGSGTLFSIPVVPDSFPKTIMMILPPGAFLTLGLLMALFNYIKLKRRNN